MPEPPPHQAVEEEEAVWKGVEGPHVLSPFLRKRNQEDANGGGGQQREDQSRTSTGARGGGGYDRDGSKRNERSATCGPSDLSSDGIRHRLQHRPPQTRTSSFHCTGSDEDRASPVSPKMPEGDRSPDKRGATVGPRGLAGDGIRPLHRSNLLWMSPYSGQVEPTLYQDRQKAVSAVQLGKITKKTSWRNTKAPQQEVPHLP